MFSSVTSWLGVGVRPSSPVASDDDKENQTSNSTTPSISSPTESVNSSVGDTKTEDSTTTSEGEELSAKQALEELSTNAINSAKELGNFLFSFGKAAGRSMADTAKQIKTTVEEKTMIGEFVKEQDKFVSEKKEYSKQQDASVPPWIGYNEEEQMKEQILALSQDKRNFLRNPPSGVQFQFDFNVIQPVAMATLQEDPNLQKMRFELVPKMVKEEVFWRNYFYRVSLIKQSAQLTYLAQSSGSTGESRSPSSSPTESEHKDSSSLNSSPLISEKDQQVEQVLDSPTNENEFVSDAFTGDEISEEDLRREMEQLGVKEDKKEEKENVEGTDSEWEKELQQELQDYEMIAGSEEIEEDDDLEQEILKQIEQEASSLK